MNIPATYYKNNEDYVTIPAIKNFMHNHPDGQFKISQPREDLMNQIITYAEKENKEEIVYDWLDEVIQEGIKDIYIEQAILDEKLRLIFNSEKDINNYLTQFVNKTYNKHICLNEYNENFILINSYYSIDSLGKKVVFIYCKKLRMHDKKKQVTKIIDYPVTAEYYIDRGWLLVCAKPRSNLYIYNSQEFNIEDAISTTTDKQIKEVVGFVKETLKLEKSDKVACINKLKNSVFNLLHKYTNTPVDILNVMESNKGNINKLSSSIYSLCNNSEKCAIPTSMQEDIEKDINNIVEKYLSINWKDKQIFIQDREAYPVKLSATDEEESKVEQSAALLEPLQTKALFFDNKKMLYKSKQCDGIVLQWKRKNPAFFADDSFRVKIYVNTKGYCIFKFSEYTSKDDIENVILSLIGSETNTK